MASILIPCTGPGPPQQHKRARRRTSLWLRIDWFAGRRWNETIETDAELGVAGPIYIRESSRIPTPAVGQYI